MGVVNYINLVVGRAWLYFWWMCKMGVVILGGVEIDMFNLRHYVFVCLISVCVFVCVAM